MPIYFYGQNDLVESFELYAKFFKEKSEIVEHCNVLLSGRTGMGKTTAAEVFLAIINPNPEEWCKVTCDKDTNISKWLTDNPEVKYIFLDEVHMIEHPEWLFPFLSDKTKARLFILATNKVGDLNPALYNRAHKLVFEEYSEDDLIAMVELQLYKDLKNICLDWKRIIIKAAKRNPRNIGNVTGEVNIKAVRCGFPETDSDFQNIMNRAGFDQNGFNAEERLYVNYLKKADGKVGLNTLASATKLDKKVITEVIEPDLLATGIIEIQSGGRVYTGE